MSSSPKSDRLVLSTAKQVADRLQGSAGGSTTLKDSTRNDPVPEITGKQSFRLPTPFSGNEEK
jgi:hypothetical protein